jgi:protein ImuB
MTVAGAGERAAREPAAREPAAPERAVRTLVVRCRDWPVLALGLAGDPVGGRRLEPDDPVAVVHANRVVAASPTARGSGVVEGQRRREAQGRCPGLLVVDHDPGRDARAFQVVAAAVETFTPRIELSRPGTCALITRGPSRYFGGDEALAEGIHRRVDEVLAHRGWAGAAGVGVADGPFAAELAAELTIGSAGPTDARPVRVVAPGGSPSFLAPWPTRALVDGLVRVGITGGSPASARAEAEGLVDVLVRLGLRTLGAFAALSGPDVLARFGLGGQLAHRLASGLDERAPSARVPPPHLQVETVFDPPAERVDTAAFVAKSLADELGARLDRLGLACTRVAVRVETEHGESLERLWRHEGALTPGAVADRVRWQLDGWLNASAATRPTSGITFLALVPDEVVAATGRQLDLWGTETTGPEQAERAFARVQGLLGPDAVTVPEWQGGRGPGEQYRRVSLAAVDVGGREVHPDRSQRSGSWADPPWPGRVPVPAPALVAVEPVGGEVVDDGGVVVSVSGRGSASAAPARLSIAGGPWVELVGWAGPWPADERWWDPPTHRRRARFQVVDTDGRAYLLAVEGGRWWVEATYD